MASKAAAPGAPIAAAPSSKSGSKKDLKPEPVPENFWTEGGYKRVVKRIEDGTACIDTFARMIQERAALERRHANSLIDWSKRWDQRLEKAPTFKEGTLDTAWRGLLTEAESTAAVMKDLENVLVKEVRETLLTWKKANYPTFLGRNKVAKKANADFEKARKPYEKAHSEETKKKAEYFKYARQAHDLDHRIHQAKQYQTATAAEDVHKLEAELEKTKPLLAKARTAYEERVRARVALTDQYRRDMAAVFAKYDVRSCA